MTTAPADQIFTLPARYRPSSSRTLMVLGSDDFGVDPLVSVNAAVTTAGEIAESPYPTPSIATTIVIPDGTSYSID